MNNDPTLRSKWVALALATCANCEGTGMRSARTICGCIYRNITRECMNKVRDCMAGHHIARPMRIDGVTKKLGSRTFGHKPEEFASDVYLTAQRTLTDAAEWGIFRFHFLLGADWKLCCRRLNITRGAFFHSVYRIEQNLGRTFLELKPYAIWPLDEYFQVTSRTVDVRPLAVPDERHPNGIPLRPPLAPRPPEAEPAPCELAPESAAPAVIVLSPKDPEPAPVEPAAPAVAVVPVPSIDPTDKGAIARYVRDQFRVGRRFRSIGIDLNRLGIPAPDCGKEWTAPHVKRVLLNWPVDSLDRAA
jgi:hypothetical protein